MARTRPTGEQLRFRSAFTGDHVLDAYLEAAEKGARTLPDLLDDIFDASGNFTRGSGAYAWAGDYTSPTPYIRGDTFRDPATADLYVVLRAFTSTGSLTTDVANGNIARCLDASVVASYRDAARTYRDQALAYRDTAGTHAGAATTKAGEAAASAASALAYRNAAQTYRDEALTYRNAALGYRDQAQTHAANALASADAAAATLTDRITFAQGDARYARINSSATFNDAVAVAGDQPVLRMNSAVHGTYVRLYTTAADDSRLVIAITKPAIGTRYVNLPHYSIPVGANDLITQGDGDSRYARLDSANTFSGDVILEHDGPVFRLRDASSAGNAAFQSIEFRDAGNALQARIGHTTANDHFYVFNYRGGPINFFVDGSYGARVDAAGTSVPHMTSIITREKGDARYAQLGVSNTFSGNITLQDKSPIFRLRDTVAGNAAYQSIEFRDSENTLQSRIGHWAGDDFFYIVNYRGGPIKCHVGGSHSAQIESVGTSVPHVNSVITREKGDARYALASSGRIYKDAIADAPPVDLSPLVRRTWTWGGVLTPNDPRFGEPGSGLLADDVAAVLPEAVRYDDDGRPAGIDALTMIGALVASHNALAARVAALEAV